MEPADPWAETKLSRAAAEWQPTVGEDPQQLVKKLKGATKHANLYDLHHPKGALAKVSPFNPPTTALILSQVGFPVEVDTETGRGMVNGKPRHLWTTWDSAIIDLPTTVHRRGYPERYGLISVTPQGLIRVTAGDAMSVSVFEEDVEAFLKNWAKRYGPDLDRRPKPRLMDYAVDSGIYIHIRPDGGLTYDLQEVSSIDSLQEMVQAVLSANSHPIFVVPDPQSKYGRMVQVLDRLVTIAENGHPIRYTLPHGDLSRPDEPVGVLRRLRPKPNDDNILVLRIDRAAKFRDVQPILDFAAKHVDRVVLRTDLDLSEPSRIDASTWPGGLPGGLTIALAHPTRDQLAGR